MSTHAQKGRRRIIIVVAAALAIAAPVAGQLAAGARAAAPAMDMTMKSAITNVAAAPKEIEIDNFAFMPATLTVAAGTKVVWVNRDDEPHTVVFSGAAKLFKSPPLDTGETFSFVFAAKGSYDYYCSIHPHMTGTVIVE